MTERLLVEDPMLDIWAPEIVDDSISWLEWSKVPDTANQIMASANKIPQPGMTARFQYSDANNLIIPSKAYLSILWQPVDPNNGNAVITDGRVAPANTFPLWEGIKLTYGSSQMESSPVFLPQKNLMKNLLKYGAEESLRGGFIERCWNLDTGISPTQNQLNTSTYYTPGPGVVSPTLPAVFPITFYDDAGTVRTLSISGGDSLTFSAGTPNGAMTATITINNTTAIPVTFTDSSGTISTIQSATLVLQAGGEPSAGVIRAFAIDPTTKAIFEVCFTDSTGAYFSLTTTHVANAPITPTSDNNGVVVGNASGFRTSPNPSFNVGFYQRQQYAQTQLNQGSGTSWGSVNGGAGAIATQQFLFDLADTLANHDKVVSGGDFQVEMTVANDLAGLLVLAQGQTPPTTPYTVSILNLMLYVPVVKMNPLVDARFFQKLTEKPVVESLFELVQPFVYTIQNINANPSLISWQVGVFSSKVRKVYVFFRYSTSFGTNANQLYNRMVWQPLPATNVNNAWVEMGSRSYPQNQLYPGNTVGGNTLNQLITTNGLLDNRLMDFEASPCLNYTQTGINGCYSALAFDLRFGEPGALSGGSGAMMTLNINLNAGTGSGANNIPYFPNLPTNAQIQIMALVFQEGKMITRYLGNRSMSITAY